MSSCVKPLLFIFVFHTIIGCSPVMRKPRIESIVAKWGTGSAEHDRYVVDALLTSVNGVRSHGMSPQFFDALTRRLRERPELLRQVFEGIRKDWGAPACDDDDWCIPRLLRYTMLDPQNPSKQCLYLFVIAAMFDRPDWVSDLQWEDVPERWQVVSAWLRDNMYYAVYDSNAETYTIDESARKAGRRVPPACQSWQRCD